MALFWASARLVLAGISLLTTVSTFLRLPHAWAQVVGHMDFVTVEARDVSLAGLLMSRGCAAWVAHRSRGLDLLVSGTSQRLLERL